ncbi:MAG TPA: antibiotic biosynthesis monooxygenase family protein [Myxococcaceae bacterium]|nr:antibiotic biosynthesis monooxygenase family protein [Myxococcaceae bacterium]
MLSIDPASHPDLRFRIDVFAVPDSARSEFQAAMTRNLAFLRTRPGFRGHEVFERTAGPGRYDVVTVAVWESQAAMDRAAAGVRDYYREIGFDPAHFMAERGIAGEVATFRAVPEP